MSVSRAADRLLAHRERVLELWIARVRAEIPAAAKQPEPLLVDTVPRLLHNLAEALHEKHPRSHATQGNSIAQEHGGERARMTAYKLDSVIREYQLLRGAVLEVLEDTGPVTGRERETIILSIDAAMSESCATFTALSDSLRERFMLTLAHDLRGPLTAARAGAQLILRKPDAPDVPRYAAKVVEAVDRVDGMIRDLLDVGRVGAGQRLVLSLAPCDLVALARAAVETLELTYGQRFLVVAMMPSLQAIADEDALRRALENLLINAVKYGGAHRPVTLTLTQNRERAQISVHNDGSYIPMEERETLFAAFRRRTEVERGTTRGWGLGLPLVRAVAEAHGGSVEVDSTPALGTTFIMDFALDARPFQEAPTTE